MADFTIPRPRPLPFPSPPCGAPPGPWSRRPSGHRAADLHRARGIEADRVFIDQHGPDASIIRIATGWQVDPRGRARD
ncbi:hypothetical protein MR829_23590 [Paracoccus versutus]|uniref:hypothetical protein n=1 Tax=Paracoccus versutus TaxID=34007 RepID=UPI001FB79D89|nr:hypothetical protein [Paracoccus versutus]MCJ1903306.1 hypothetical protein [Paracoccus versutus]